MKRLVKRSVKKRGELLIGNIVFIIINLVFISLLITFLSIQGNNAHLLEQMYAKEIALSIDYAKPTMLLKLDMEKGMKVAKKNAMRFEDAVDINGNTVTVKLSKDSGYTYSFFNDVDARAYPDRSNSNYNGLYIITVGGKSNA